MSPDNEEQAETIRRSENMTVDLAPQMDDPAPVRRVGRA
jgi:hypothetical protein